MRYGVPRCEGTYSDVHLFSITILTCKVCECPMLFPLPTMLVHTMPLLVMLQDVDARGVLA